MARGAERPPLNHRSRAVAPHSLFVQSQAVTDLLGLLFLQEIYKQDPLACIVAP
jgi:hypothetical protein